MKNKQLFFAKIPFTIFAFIILIVVLLDLLDAKLGIILMITCLGFQQLFIGLKFYKEDKRSKISYLLFGAGCFIVALCIGVNIFYFI